MPNDTSIIRFGNDGWKARFDDGFNEAAVVRLAAAAGLAWADVAPASRVYVGYDTRFEAETHARAAAAALASFGLDVVVSKGACPTPALAWTCAQDSSAIGAFMLTASELSCEYGGVILRGADGGPLTQELLQTIEDLISANPSPDAGSFEVANITSSYFEHLTTYISRERIAQAQLRCVLDPMYGAGRTQVAAFLESLGIEVFEIHGEPFTDFGGIHPEPQDPWADKCEQAVNSLQADAGFLLDGDGDRMGVVGENGVTLAPYQVVALLLEHLVHEHGQTGTLASTLSNSSAIYRQAELLGLDHVEVPVGFQRLYREACEGNVLLCADELGGICLPSHLLERDGILSILLFCEMLAITGKGPAALAKELDECIGPVRHARRDLRFDPARIQSIRNILPGINPPELAGHTPKTVSHADGLRLDFDKGAWVAIRPSRTDPVVRVHAEAQDEGLRDELLEAACELIRSGI